MALALLPPSREFVPKFDHFKKVVLCSVAFWETGKKSSKFRFKKIY